MAANPSKNVSLHVHGPVILEANIGSSNGWVQVGEAQNGVDLTLIPFTRGIKHDGGGGPEGDDMEIIFLNFSIVAVIALVPYSGVYVNKLRAMSMANPTGTDGVMVVPGTLYGAIGSLPSVRFASNNNFEVDGGWQLNTCQVRIPGGYRAGNLESAPQFEFRAINYRSPTNATIQGNTLYSRI